MIGRPHQRLRPIERFAASMPTSSAELLSLMQRVAGRDQTAFAALYEATSAKLYGTVLRIVRSRDAADDIVQEAYVRIWNNAATFDPTRASPIAWMAAIARNRALDEVRRKVPVSTEDLPDSFEVADPQPLVTELLDNADDARRLADCLDALDPDRRAIVRLAYLDGLSREELGRRFGHPAATIKTWLHRSLKQLKGCMTS